jgi:sn-1 stearoyl-lipid 9-desaturase
MHLLILGSACSLQGSWKKWAREHKVHHLRSNTDLDVHDANRGFLYSHIGWMMHKRIITEEELRMEASLPKDAILTILSWQWVGVFLQIAIGCLLFTIGGWGMVIWGVFIRVVLVWNATWSVNSITHKWGYRHFETKDGSYNNPLVNLFTNGEGLHNTHHRWPSSSQNSLRWWEIDISGILIRFFHLIGLVKSYRTIPKS